MSEIIVALIVAISTISVAIIQYGNKNKKKQENNKIITNEDVRKLKDEKNSIYNDREELYNELTMAIAKNLCEGAEKREVMALMDKCKEIDTKFKQASDDYIDALTKMVEGS